MNYPFKRTHSEGILYPDKGQRREPGSRKVEPASRQINRFNPEKLKSYLGSMRCITCRMHHVLEGDRNTPAYLAGTLQILEGQLEIIVRIAQGSALHRQAGRLLAGEVQPLRFFNDSPETTGFVHKPHNDGWFHE